MDYSTRHYGAGKHGCRMCGGVGWVQYDVPEGDYRFGRAYHCPECRVAKMEDTWLEDVDATMKIAEDIWWDYPGREEMGRAVQQAIARYTSGDTSGLLTLVGKYGCGKSILAAEIVRACAIGHISALYVTADRFKEAVSASMGRDDGEHPDLLRIRNTPVVVFDQPDWIRERTNSGNPTFAAERARDIFDSRYARKRSRATVYVVNIDAWEMSGNDTLAALYDRMKDGEVAIATNPSLRQGS